MIKILQSINLNDFINLRLESLEQNPESFLSTFVEEVNYTKQDWQNKLQSGYWFGYFDNDQLCAMINLQLSNKIKTAHIAEIGGLYIKKQLRKSGIAKKLILFAEEFCIQKNILQIYLGCNAENEVAINLYKKLSYQIIATRPDYAYSKLQNKYFDDLIMLKIL